jgi:DNA mismatch endonuclease (patch repair protein)
MTIDPQRSATMRAVKSRDTKPELEIRSWLHRSGYRFRLHRKDLPGTPDIVFPGLHKVVFVHGCFWHRHSCRRGKRIPKNNRDYWVEKVRRNVARDGFNVEQLREQGWRVFVVWECQIGCLQLMEDLRAFLATT